MASPAQADVVNELYSRRDSLPSDKKAVVEELYGRLNSALKSDPLHPTEEELQKGAYTPFSPLPESIASAPIATAFQMARGYLGSKIGGFLGSKGAEALNEAHPDWSPNTQGYVQAAGEGVGNLVGGGLAASPKVGRAVKAGLEPKPGGRISKVVEALKGPTPAAAPPDPRFADSPNAGGTKKQALKFTAGPEAASGPSSPPVKITPNSRGGVPSVDLPDASGSGSIRKQASKFTPSPEPNGGGSPAKAPVNITPNMRGGAPEAEALVSAPDSRFEDNPGRGTLKKQLLKKTASSGNDYSGGPSRPPQRYNKFTEGPAKAAPAAEDSDVEGIAQAMGGKSFSKLTPEQQKAARAISNKIQKAVDDLPEGGPKRAPRSDAEAQRRSDEIASLKRHADVIPIAQQAVADKVSSKQLLDLDSEQRASFMKNLGLGGRSPDTWRALVGHVQRLEKGK